MFLDCFEYFFACTPLSLSSSGQLVHAGCCSVPAHVACQCKGWAQDSFGGHFPQEQA